MSNSKRTSRKSRRATTTPPRHDRPHLTLPVRLLAAISLAAVMVTVIFLAVRPVHDPDSWFHLTLGNYILSEGTLPRVDPFSHTAGNTPYVPSGWLTSVLMAVSERFYPESSLGPILLATIFAAGAALVVIWRAWKTNTIVLSTIALLAGLGLAATRFSPRPDTFSVLGITALLALLTHPWTGPNGRHIDAPPSPKLLWLIPLLIVIWANLHAGVLIAIPFLLLYGTWLIYRGIQANDKAWYRAALPIAVACFAWLLTPYGTGPVGLAWRISQMPHVEWVMEWMPLFKPGFPMPWTTYAMLAILAGFCVWVLSKRWPDVHPLETTWIIALFILALMQRRHVGLAGLGIPLLLARHLHGDILLSPQTLVRTGKFAVPAFALALIGLQVSGANGNGSGMPRIGRNCVALPCFTADFLAQTRPPGKMFNSYNIGGYLLHILYPETKVYIDGRLDTYPAHVWLDMLALEENEMDVDTFAAKYDITTFVTVTDGSFGAPESLPARLALHPGYALAYLDDKAAVFVHRTPETEDYLANYGYSVLDPWNLLHQTELLANPATQPRVVREIERLAAEAPASATVHALAGFVAWALDDHGIATLQLNAARRIDDSNELLNRVDLRIGKAAAILHRDVEL